MKLNLFYDNTPKCSHWQRCWHIAREIKFYEVKKKITEIMKDPLLVHQDSNAINTQIYILRIKMRESQILTRLRRMSLPTGGCSSPVSSARPERKPSPPSSPARAPARAPAPRNAPQRAAPTRMNSLPSALRRKANPHHRRLSDNRLRRRQLCHRHLLLHRRDFAPPSGQGNASEMGKLNPNWSCSTICTNCAGWAPPLQLTGMHPQRPNIATSSLRWGWEVSTAVNWPQIDF
jgi:hypothetical protein